MSAFLNQAIWKRRHNSITRLGGTSIGNLPLQAGSQQLTQGFMQMALENFQVWSWLTFSET